MPKTNSKEIIVDCVPTTQEVFVLRLTKTQASALSRYLDRSEESSDEDIMADVLDCLITGLYDSR